MPKRRFAFTKRHTMKSLLRSCMSLLTIITISAVFSSYSEGGPATHKIDPQQSKLLWRGYYLFSFGEHFGTIQISDGEVQIENEQITSGFFSIDMKTIKNLDMAEDNGAKDLEAHLMSDDFFSVDKFPKATFEITKSEKIKDAGEGEPNYDITGNLTIKGVKNSLKFPAIVIFNEHGIEAKARFKIDRTKWNVHYNSGKFFADIGDGAISDAIGFEISLVTSK